MQSLLEQYGYNGSLSEGKYEDIMKGFPGSNASNKEFFDWLTGKPMQSGTQLIVRVSGTDSQGNEIGPKKLRFTVPAALNNFDAAENWLHSHMSDFARMVFKTAGISKLDTDFEVIEFRKVSK